MAPERDDVIYLAGLLDGEGCITISSRGSKVNDTATVVVSNTDARVMTWLKATFGGSVRLQAKQVGNRKACWQWRVYARQAERILVSARPFLRVKAEQADVVLAYRELRHPELRDRIRLLNRKGVA